MKVVVNYDQKRNDMAGTDYEGAAAAGVTLDGTVKTDADGKKYVDVNLYDATNKVQIAPSGNYQTNLAVTDVYMLVDIKNEVTALAGHYNASAGSYPTVPATQVKLKVGQEISLGYVAAALNGNSNKTAAVATVLNGKNTEKYEVTFNKTANDGTAWTETFVVKGNTVTTKSVLAEYTVTLNTTSAPYYHLTGADINNDTIKYTAVPGVAHKVYVSREDNDTNGHGKALIMTTSTNGEFTSNNSNASNTAAAPYEFDFIAGANENSITGFQWKFESETSNPAVEG